MLGPSSIRTSPFLALLLVTFLALPFSPAQEEEQAEADPALQQYFVANGAYNRKLYPIAIQQFEEFLKNHGTHPKADLARRGLALSHYASKQYKEAIPSLATLLAKQNLDPSISRERLVMMHGQCLLLTGEKDKAKALYVAELTSLKAPAFLTAALASISDVSFGNSRWEEVLKWSAQLLAAKPSPDQAARGFYQQGYAHYQLEKPGAAIAALNQIQALGANQVWATRAAYLLGECHNQQKDFQKAEAAFLTALPNLSGADAVECRYRLGLTRFILKNYKESTADLKAYLAAAPEGAHRAEAQLYVARAALETSSFKTAGTQLTALAAGQGETAARASLWLARVHTRPDEKNYAAAAAVLGPATKKFASSSIIDDLRFDYANALMAREDPDWKTALANLQQIQVGGKFSQMAEVLSQRAVCLQKLQDYETSLAANGEFLARHGTHPLAARARFMQAENLFLLDRREDALAAFDDFLTKHIEHPDRTAAIFRTAQLHHAAGRWKECLDRAAPLLSAKTGKEDPLFAQLPFMVGDALFRQEKWSGAIPPLEAFLAPRVSKDTTKGVTVVADPNVDTALIQLALCYDRTDRRDQAVAHLTTLANHYPEPTPQLPLALAELGRLSYHRGNLKVARATLERFVASDTSENDLFAKHATAQRPRVQYYLGWIDATEQKFPAAADRFAKVVALDATHELAPDAALQQGIALSSADQKEEAATHLAGVLQQYPKHPKLARVVFHAGLARARLEEWESAAVHFRRVAQSFPKSEFADQALYQLAWCERAEQKLDAATAVYEKFLSLHPESPLAPKVQSELAELIHDSGAQDKVIAQLTATLKDVEDAALREELRYQLASAHFKKGDYKNAATQFEKLLVDYPKSRLLASMQFHAGESQWHLEQHDKARAHFTAAAKQPGLSADMEESITMRLAETQALTAQHQLAAKTYATFLQRFPESRWIRNAQFGFALATENAGNPQVAQPAYQKLLTSAKVDLWTVRSHFQTGLCHAALKQYDQAIVEFVKVEISFPQYPAWQARAVLEIGRILQEQKKPAQAAERFQEVIKRFGKEDAAAEARKLLDASKP